MRVHLRTLNPAYPACGANNVPAIWIATPEAWLREPKENRCRRCERSLLGEGYLKRNAPTSNGPTTDR